MDRGNQTNQPKLVNGGMGLIKWEQKDKWSQDEIISYFESKGLQRVEQDREIVIIKSEVSIEEVENVNELIFAVIYKGGDKKDDETNCALLCIDVKSLIYFKDESPDTLEIFGLGDEIYNLVQQLGSQLN